MRLLLEGEPEEFEEKRDELVKALVERFTSLDPTLAHVLEKALPHKEPVLKYRALRDLQKRTKAAYHAQLERMVVDIGRVLDQGVQKSQVDVELDALRKAARERKKAKDSVAYTKVEGSLYSCNECEHWSPGTPVGEKPNRCMRHFSGEGEFAPNARCMFWKKGEPVPGLEPDDDANLATKNHSKYRVNDYHTGFKCNRCRYWVEGGACELVEGDIELTATCMLWEVVYNTPVPIQKSLQKFIGGGVLHKQEEGDDPDYTEEGEPIINPQTGLTPSEQQAEEDQGIADVYEEEGEDLKESVQKALAGPYIGPRGGKWADPEHTISWRDASTGLSKLKEFVKQHGGKIKAHKTDASKVMIKVPKNKAALLHALKTELKVGDAIKVGSNYALLAVDTVATTKALKQAVKKVKAKKAAPGKAKFQIPPYAGVSWTEPKSVDDASAWCDSFGIHADFPDLPTAIEVTKAISESHPSVVAHLQFIGTPEQQKEWAKLKPDIANDPKVKHPINLQKSTPLGGGAVAVAHPLTAKPYTRSIIVVKPSYWNEKKAKEAKAKVGGFTVSNSLGDTVRHELGHVEAFVLRHSYPTNAQGKSSWEVWKKHVKPQLQKKQVAKDISQYGNTNPHEAWAELAVLRRRGHPVPSWVQEALDAMQVDSHDWNGMTK